MSDYIKYSFYDFLTHLCNVSDHDSIDPANQYLPKHYLHRNFVIKLCIEVVMRLKELHDKNTAHGRVSSFAFIFLEEKLNEDIKKFHKNPSCPPKRGTIVLQLLPNTDPRFRHGAHYFTAPECLKDDKINNLENDIWSLGIVFWQIMSLGGIPNYYCKTKEEILKVLNAKAGPNVEVKKPPFNKPDSEPMFVEEIWELAKKCCNYNPNNRPNIKEILDELNKLAAKCCNFGPDESQEKILEKLNKLLN